jgi:DNA (cytosine-5)-methyltransferase 1
VLTVGSLFSGIGGLDLGLERAGMQVIWQSEIDPYCCKVLKKHWPEVTNYGDIREVDWSTVARPDVVCGGYPCQPFSNAGKRNGTADPRHLWPAMFDAIRNLRPRYALMENVRGHLSMGFRDVLSDLASIGFNAEWQIIPAAAIGAPHKRDRLFVVAYAQSSTGRNAEPYGLAEVFKQTPEFGKPISAGAAFCDWWKIEPDVGRVANGVSDRVDKLRGLGNAVVPQVAELLGHLIIKHSE